MLPLIIPSSELWDEKTEQFFYTKETHLQLEHSLISISNWEMKWHIPYFDTTKSAEQALDYIKCMCLTKNVPSDVFKGLTTTNVQQINDYMLDPMTATTIGEIQDQKPQQKRVVTSELIYYWMIKFGIPFTCDKWHINKLIMLIRVCAEEDRPKKERAKKDIAADYRRINAARRKKYNTKG